MPAVHGAITLWGTRKSTGLQQGARVLAQDLLHMWPWADVSPFLGNSFFICKMNGLNEFLVFFYFSLLFPSHPLHVFCVSDVFSLVPAPRNLLCS